jgi:asparagine synthase (glutamine-hydrolysing)
MSGIVAIVNFDGAPVDPQVLKAMAEQCAYRGPDGIRYWIRGNVGLAHLALHATPESLREVQPQLSQDGTLCLTADVRVDNRPELIHLLAAKGEPITSNSTDADLLLAAYRLWGEACPAQVIGDYAFAIWDARKQRLFCARDAFGIKSLHYAQVGSTLCVASEAQQIIQHPKVPRILDEVTVAFYLVDYLKDETRTMFLDVHKLPPAHILVADPTGLQLQRYWDIDPHFQTIHQNDEEYAAHFLEIFQRAVFDRMRTQGGTIGINMSGGMDSTSIAAIAQQISNQQAGQPHLLACSYAFDHLKECDERLYSQAMADELGIELVYVPAENFWLLDDDETFTPSLETPFMVSESLTRYIFSIFKNRGARVCFSGHGGDSLVGGSPLIYADQIQRGNLVAIREVARLFRWFNAPTSSLMQEYLDYFLKPLIPETVRHVYRTLRKPPLPTWLETDFVRRTQIKKRLIGSPIPKYFPDHARQDNYQHIIALGGVGRAVNLLERLATLFHLEARHPFLDRRLVEFIFSIPPEQTFRAGLHKFILRKAMRGILPEVVRTRMDKTDLSGYFDMGLRYKETEKIKVLLREPLQSKLKLVYLRKIQRVYEHFISGSHSMDSEMIWFSITLELWLRKYYHHFFSQGVEHGETKD